MSYTVRNLRRDPQDIGAAFDGPEGLEFRAATAALGLEHMALTYQHLPPGCRFPYGHRHVVQEETYIVVGGGGRMRLGDEVIDLARWDVVRVSPDLWRGYEAGPDGLDLIVVGAPALTDPRTDVEGRRGWWGG